ncbi:MAG TPA: type II toxin-antitoxin system Phd/YefM family antitoxin [Frankiaceae bacterium]|nr:type II toxin-antitoxin system Phd/YefM family antitoxin [Frankiaceae bacterium]
MVRTEPLERARDHLAELADEVEQKGAHVVLTRFGHEDVVVVSLREWEAMQDAVDLAHDPEAQRRIAESRAAHRSGDCVTGDQLRAEYDLLPSS